ncbi:MAG: GBS Bsp-like repeat-containing protein [Lachnospiraceae bacterium]|nr:GBS Bsp-like repeat-containing protein [Lachnospiraceae bacterium]
MNTRKRILSILLCIAMVFSYGGYTPLAAGEDESNEGPGYRLDNLNSAIEEMTGETSDSNDAADPFISYVVVENENVNQGEEQFVLIGLNAGDAQGVVLNYQNDTTGEGYSVAADTYDSESALFKINTSDITQGVYTLKSVEVIYSDRTVMLDIQETGISAVFGVGEQAEANPDGVIVSEGEDEISSLVITDADGNEISAEDFSEALSGEEITETDIGVGSKKGKIVIVLDPGHGGSDSGATRTWNGVTYMEKTLNLKITQYCKAELDKYDTAEVYMTRNSDVYLSLAERTAYANSVGADVLISFHNNSASRESANGANVYYPNDNYRPEFNVTGKELATTIENKLVALGLYNGGIHTRTSDDPSFSEYLYPDGSTSDYYGIIRGAKGYGFPGLIIEHAFISNQADCEKYLSSEEALKKLGVADAQAIAEFFKLADPIYEENTASIVAANGGNGAYTLIASNVGGAYNVSFWVTCESTKVEKEYGAMQGSGSDKNWYANFNANDFGTSGKYKIEAYVNRKGGGSYKVGETTIEVTGVAEGPKISAYNADGDKTIFLTAANIPNENAVSKVWFDLTTPDGKTVKQYQAAKQADGRWLAMVGIKEYKQSGTYSVKAYDNYNNENKLIGTTSFNISEPTASSISVENVNYNKGTFDIVIRGVSAKAGLALVRVPAWTAQDLSDLHWYVAEDAGNGTYIVHADIKNHQNHYGVYALQAYVMAQNDIETVPVSICYNLAEPTASIWPYDVGDNTTFIIGTENIPYAGEVAGVKVAIWNEGITDLHWYGAMQDEYGRWLAFVNVGNDYKKAGIYYADSYVTYKDGTTRELGVCLFRVHEPTAKSIYVTNVNGTAGTFDVIVSGVSCPSGVTSVRIPAWTAADLSDLHWYSATKQKDGTYKTTVNIVNHKGHYGTYVMQAYIMSGNGVETVPVSTGYNFKQSDETLYTIEGSSSTTVDQMVKYYKKNATYPAFYANSDAPAIEDFCKIYYEECQAEGIKAEVAFCQAMKETGFLKFGGDVKIEQYNFCGLGATGGGEPGHSFGSVREGVRAHIQHLKAYSSNKALANPCVDPRFSYVTRGTAPYVEWLGINENPYGKGWAVAVRYGYSLRNDYISKLLDF